MNGKHPRSFNLADLFTIAAETVPGNEAIVCGSMRRTFRALEERATRLALHLRACGVGAGDTVGLQMYNCPEYIEGFFAALKLKALPFNINYRYVSDELRYLYANAAPRALIFDAALEARVADALDAAPRCTALVRVGSDGQPLLGACDCEEAIAAAHGSLDDILRTADDLSLLYTGGTTGMPKGVMWPHAALFFGSLGGGGLYAGGQPIERPEELADRIRAAFPMRNLPAAPLMHAAALWATLIWLYSGHTVVLDDGREFDAERIWDLAERERLNSISIVGDAMAVPLLDALEANPGRWDLSNILNIGSGGAVFSAHVKAGLKAHLPEHAVMTDSMGSSESGQVGLGSRTDSGGLLSIPPRPDVIVVVDRRIAQSGETGFMARSGNVAVGYYGDPVKTAETFVRIDGRNYVITGDAARLEADGSITVFGRGSNCVNTGGEKVFPEEVEEALRRHPDVADALVVGVADPRWGQKVVAVVALRHGSDAGAEELRILRTHCRAHLAGYKVPKDIVFVNRVMRSPAGKADYRWAKATAEAGLGIA